MAERIRVLSKVLVLIPVIIWSSEHGVKSNPEHCHMCSPKYIYVYNLYKNINYIKYIHIENLFYKNNLIIIFPHLFEIKIPSY